MTILGGFEPLHTERLVLRVPRMSDVDALVARRNDPVVAEYQDWTLPYTREQAERAAAWCIEAGGPVDGHFWAMTIASAADDATVIGDLAVKLEWQGRAAEVGYTLAREHWGNGYAVEALDALVDWLFSSPGMTRVHAQLHPENTASAQVVERLGFGFEGHTRRSFWVGDENSDDWLYGLTRDDWLAWKQRTQHAPETVTLVEVDASNQHAVRRLQVHNSQNRFVAPVVASMADALFPEVVDGAPVVPWMRAVEADGALVGFVMLAQVTEAHPEPYLWRFLIDRRHQRRGLGRRVLDLVVDEVRRGGNATLMTSWVDGRGSPRPFYERYGFVPTGDVVDGEIEARLVLDAASGSSQ